MAKVRPELPEAAVAYDRDFVAWTEQQARRLRRAALGESVADLDFGNLALEIESLGKRDRRALANNLARILEHVLKLQFSPAKDPRPGWENSVDMHRAKARRILADSPSLGTDLQAMLVDSYDDGRRRAIRALRGEIEATGLPQVCPYAIDQILDQEWWP